MIALSWNGAVWHQAVPISGAAIAPLGSLLQLPQIHDAWFWLLMLIGWTGWVAWWQSRTALKACFISHDQDCTRVQVALQEQEKALQSFVDAFPDQIMRVRQDGTRLALWPGEVSLECGPDGRKGATELPPDLARQQLEAVQRAIATGELQVYTYQVESAGIQRDKEARIIASGEDEAFVLVRDITSIKSQEEELRRYERVVSATADGISLLDRNYVYQIVNETYLRYSNKLREEIVGHSVSDLLGQEVFETVVKPQLDQCLAGGPVQYEAWFTVPTLGNQFLSVTYAPYREMDGTISGVVASSRNLTAVKLAEQALKESELRFRGIFNQMYQFIGLLTPDGTLLEANQTALEFGGLEMADVVGKPFWEAPWWQTSPEVQEQLKGAIARAAQGEFVRYEANVQGAQQRVITIDFSLRPIFDEAGHVVLLIPEGRDISERIQAEKLLELQALITRTMAEGICMVRAADGIIVYANPKFERMFGYGPEELHGQHVSMVNYEDDQISAMAVYEALSCQVIDRGDATYTIHNVKKDGTPFWCQATTSVFDHPDHGTVLVAVQQDITQRKQAEETLRASLAEKEVLLKEVHHRVKNNLQIVDGLLQMQARRTVHPQVAAALQDSQSRIASIALVHEKLYRSENLAQIDFAQYIPDLTVHLFETYDVNAQQVQLRTHIEPLFLDIERAIPCGLIINELVSNALKYAFSDGRNGTIDIYFRQEKDQLILVIRDNGVGLPEGINLPKAQTLGMTLVQGLIEQLEGNLEVTHVPGATFTITFPVRTE